MCKPLLGHNYDPAAAVTSFLLSLSEFRRVRVSPSDATPNNSRTFNVRVRAKRVCGNPPLPPRYSRVTCDLTPPIRGYPPSTPLALPTRRCCKHQNSHYLASGLTCTLTRPPPGCSSCAPTRVPADTLHLLHSLPTSPVWVHVQLLTKLCPLLAKHHHRWRICSKLS